MSTPCCRLAEQLSADRLEALDAELQKPNHRSFHKLAAEIGTNHTAIRRHKRKCLEIGPAEEGGTTAGTAGTVEQRAEVVPGVPEEGERTPLEQTPPRARAPVPGKEAGSQADRIAAIRLRIVGGELVPGDVPTWAEAWGLTEGTVRSYVSEAYRHVELDRGTVDERRILAMGKWDNQIRLVDEALNRKRKRPLSATEESFLLKERASAITGWCKAAGVFDDSTKLTVNISGNPVFLAVTEALFQALVPYPEARAAAQAALSARLQVLRQGPPVPSAVITVPAEPAPAPGLPEGGRGQPVVT